MLYHFVRPCSGSPSYRDKPVVSLLFTQVHQTTLNMASFNDVITVLSLVIVTLEVSTAAVALGKVVLGRSAGNKMRIFLILLVSFETIISTLSIVRDHEFSISVRAVVALLSWVVLIFDTVLLVSEMADRVKLNVKGTKVVGVTTTVFLIGMLAINYYANKSEFDKKAINLDAESWSEATGELLTKLSTAAVMFWTVLFSLCPCGGVSHCVGILYTAAVIAAVPAPFIVFSWSKSGGGAITKISILKTFVPAITTPFIYLIALAEKRLKKPENREIS